MTKTESMLSDVFWEKTKEAVAKHVALQQAVEKSFIAHLDRRILDIATEPMSFVSLDDYRTWQGAGTPQLGHLWTAQQIRDCAAASWQDACSENGVAHWEDEWRGFRVELLSAWGVTP
jgi:hypothetical protein